MQRKLSIITIVLMFATLSWRQLHAQVVDERWQGPLPLSSPAGLVNEAAVIADAFGYVHIFWPETFPDANATVIQYARYDGERWSGPVDVFQAKRGVNIRNVAAAAAPDATLFVAWAAEGQIFWISSLIEGALSAQSWTEARRAGIGGNNLRLVINDVGTLHFLSHNGLSPPVSYQQLDLSGREVRSPLPLDFEVPDHYIPDNLQLAGDADGNLHAVWLYRDPDSQAFVGRLIYYARSKDGGLTWEAPTIIEEDSPTITPDEDEMLLPNPTLIASGEQIMIVYSLHTPPRRHYRLSLDGGATWSDAVPFFANLDGEAMGGGIAADAEGRIHYVAQVRWPMGLYHATYDNSRWSDPELLYLIQEDFGAEERGVEAHRVRMAITRGNQLVVAFTDPPRSPHEGQYALSRVLADIPALPTLPLPTREPGREEPAIAADLTVPERAVTDRRPFPNDRPQAVRDTQSTLVTAMMPTLALLALILILNYRRK